MFSYNFFYFRFVHDKGVLTHSHPGQPNPAHQRTTPSPAHQNPATSSLTHGHALLPSPAHHHPVHQPLCSPNVEILPVVGGAPITVVAPITAHKTRMPLDELSMTTVHHPIIQEDRKSCIVPIKPKVKKEAWQVSITVKEGRPKSSTSGEVAKTDQSQRLSIPQISTGSFVPVSSPTHTSLASIPSCTSSMPTNAGSYPQSVTHFSHPSTPTTIIDTSMEEPTDLTRRPEPTAAQPYSRQALTSPSSGGPNNSSNEQSPIVARKSKAFEVSALDYSSKDRKSASVSTKLVEQEKDAVSGAQGNSERNAPVKSARQARIERKRSLEEKEEAIKKEPNDSKPVVTRNGKKQKVDDTDSGANNEHNHSDNQPDGNTDNKNQFKKNASKTNSGANFQDQEESRKGNKKIESRQEQLERKKRAAQIAAKTAADQPPSRSKRLQRPSVSPEPEPEDEEEEILDEPEPEPELPQFETRTSSGRRKVNIIF